MLDTGAGALVLWIADLAPGFVALARRRGHSPGAAATRWGKPVRGRAWMLLIVLAAHSGWAMYPVLNKALLAYLPPFTLLMTGNGLALVIAFFVARPHLSRALWSSKTLWIFSLVTAARSVTNILSIKYTLAIYVQLVNLSTPFFVAWLSYLLLKEHVPPFTLRALLASSVGAFLVLSPHPASLQLPRGSTDLPGIVLALLSSAFLGLYMTVRDTHPTAIYFQQTLTLVILYAGLSLLSGEDWGVWRNQPAQVWLGMIVLAIVVLTGAALLQIWALSLVNAALFSTLISWRLVVALIAAWLILGERLVSLWQVIGAFIVIVVVTLYLGYQALQRTRLPQPDLAQIALETDRSGPIT
jgi:drug/metabolite transporter (DMT)-like permease